MKVSSLRTAYGEVLVALGQENPRVAVCEADLGNSTMSAMFQRAFPERYFEMGIAEANMTSFAAGLSLTDRVVFTNSFAVFAAGRAYDQIRQSIAIGRLNVKIAGSSAGLSDFGDGATHQSVEDIAIMRAIPGMTVLVPADAPQLKKMVAWMAKNDGPAYLRVTRAELPEITGEDASPIMPTVLRKGNDIAMIACGAMVIESLRAADLLAAEGIQVRVINAPCMKPFPDAAIRDLCEGVRAIITAEEHSLQGGLAAAVAWALRGDGRPMEAVAIDDCFGQSAQSQGELFAHYGLTAGDIAEKARRALLR